MNVITTSEGYLIEGTPDNNAYLYDKWIVYSTRNRNFYPNTDWPLMSVARTDGVYGRVQPLPLNWAFV